MDANAAAVAAVAATMTLADKVGHVPRLDWPQLRNDLEGRITAALVQARAAAFEEAAMIAEERSPEIHLRGSYYAQEYNAGANAAGDHIAAAIRARAKGERG